MDIKSIASKSLKIQQNRQTAISLFNNFPHERLLGTRFRVLGFAEYTAFEPSVHPRWKKRQLMLNLHI